MQRRTCCHRLCTHYGMSSCPLQPLHLKTSMFSQPASEPSLERWNRASALDRLSLSICNSLRSPVIIHRSARTDDPLQHIVTSVAFLPSSTSSPSCPCGRGLGVRPKFQGTAQSQSLTNKRTALSVLLTEPFDSQSVLGLDPLSGPPYRQ